MKLSVIKPEEEQEVDFHRNILNCRKLYFMQIRRLGSVVRRNPKEKEKRGTINENQKSDICVHPSLPFIFVSVKRKFSFSIYLTPGYGNGARRKCLQ